MIPAGIAAGSSWSRWNSPLTEAAAGSTAGAASQGPALVDIFGAVPNRFVLGKEGEEEPQRENNFSALRTAEAAGVAAHPEEVDPMPYLQSPSDLFMAFESTIDVAMQELRRFRGNLRDAEWETNNGDQIVQSLLTLSKVCLSCAEQFVLRQESRSSPRKAAENAAAAAKPLAPPTITLEEETAGTCAEEAQATADGGDAAASAAVDASEGAARVAGNPCAGAEETGAAGESTGVDDEAEGLPFSGDGCHAAGVAGGTAKGGVGGSGSRKEAAKGRARNGTSVGDSLALRRALSDACVADLHAAGVPAQLQSLADLKRVVSSFKAAASQWQKVHERTTSRWTSLTEWSGIYLSPVRCDDSAAADRTWLGRIAAAGEDDDENSLPENHRGDDPSTSLRMLLESFVVEAVSREGHPFQAAVQDYAAYFRARYCGAAGSRAATATKESFAAMVDDVHTFAAACASAFLETFPTLASVEAAGPLVRACLSTHVVTELYPSIWPLYLLRYNAEEELLYDKTCALIGRARRPDCCGLRQRFTILYPGQEYLFPEAVQLLQELPMQSSPVEKLRCLCDVLRNLCFSIEDFYRKNVFTTIAIGGEDLLSLFVYVVIVAREMGLFSQSKFLQDFVDGSTLLGSEGYALATLETAVNIIAAHVPAEEAG